ncbi:hypothetical protein SAM23877_6097 [Streptomyces ambofaciens ATCC 23877]|uniref:Uncharacterized protein n=1 Tax=Streptomyces ambofaciens (strain ATCC 23877 / 3486 / DSM 40053 / JCM 4204 / NBRC 12836 / NRRL B-2516) TaxID=278992 RepID=A0A0K2B229_STRA7|nr:hypothetical protein [Streptomyces ambofaciens]AKZ59142.1 hypothetical protein SAM23877_6097 [Streptomyces ambofaciens ATCC 23877]WNA15334.1 hypothetical protein SAMYPH_3 [Streptomyces phage Samy]
MDDEVVPYEDGGILAPVTSWVSYPEETCVLTLDQMREMLAAFDPSEPITFIHDRNY